MTKLHGTLIFKRGRYATFYDDWDKIKVNLQPDYSHYMSFDPSSNSLGVCIADTNFNYHMLLEFKRTSNNKFAFYKDVEFFFKRLLNNIKVELVVYEQPPYYAKHIKAGNVLREFVGVLKSWKYSIPSLEWAYWDDLLPHQWRKHIVDKSKGTYTDSGERRFISKVENAKDILDREPLLIHYFQEHNASSDYDGFDAYGILHGYLEERFDENGSERIMGNLKRKEPIFITCKAYSQAELYSTELFWKGIEFLKAFDFKMVTLNPSYSLMDNIRVATDKNEITIVAVTNELDKSYLMWEFDIPKRDNYIYVLFIFREKDKNGRQLLGKKQIKYLKDTMKYSYI